MSDVLNHLNKIKERQCAFHKTRIETVMNTQVPQHILATKQVVNELIADEENEGFISTEIGFCFKERLVNKLMYLFRTAKSPLQAKVARRISARHRSYATKLDEV